MKTFITILISLLLTSVYFYQVKAGNNTQHSDDFTVFYSEHKIKIHNPDSETANNYHIYSLSGTLLSSGKTQGNYSEITTDNLEGTVIFCMDNDKYGFVRIKILLR